jgi:carboxypeptidase C (cathepsin A)
MRVVIYNGQLDIIVNTPAAYNFVNQLNWNKLSQWQKVDKQVWTINNGKVVGTAKDFDNLAFVVIYGAGHMVPTDQP